ncbi:hypothetical protein [Falsiroseomonas oryzae]|uniref:hypothetical protein n=1 Tax=Falsiroseomonas oryzae TaxID=2766473 RepID=UPI0022EAE759|nr:hypothetical protein [Roseomonas sp. MO-31]
MAPHGEDETVVLRRPVRPQPQPRRSRLPLLLAGTALLAVVGLTSLMLLRPGLLPVPGLAPPSAPQVVPRTPSPPGLPSVLPAPAERFALATEAEILANAAPELVIRRFAGNPAVLVLDFPTLGEQARMLNRVAALVEKAGLPRDRVLDDAALERAVIAGGTTAETFYYGHNYRAADLARFFALADRDGVRLNPDEERLRALARELGWLRLDAGGALVSVPHAGAEAWLDARARAAMLRHELSHGEFFTNPAYAAVVWRFWQDLLSEEERARFRAMLSEASYDPALEEVMANEAHAFLFHTPDERFFNAAALGFTPERVAALRAAFVASLPPGWLRDAMAR